MILKAPALRTSSGQGIEGLRLSVAKAEGFRVLGLRGSGFKGLGFRA